MQKSVLPSVLVDTPTTLNHHQLAHESRPHDLPLPPTYPDPHGSPRKTEGKQVLRLNHGTTTFTTTSTDRRVCVPPVDVLRGLIPQPISSSI